MRIIQGIVCLNHFGSDKSLEAQHSSLFFNRCSVLFASLVNLCSNEAPASFVIWLQTLLSPAQDFDYDYRQGNIQDPFGHQWMIELKI